MPRRPEESLDDVYGRIPAVPCRGLCQDSCGPIAMSIEEDRRLQARGYRVPSMLDTVTAIDAGADYWCPALQDGSCQVYDERPAICRLWGATQSMPCPHGCTPDDALTQEQSHALLQDAGRAGGGMAARFFHPEGAGKDGATLRPPGPVGRLRQRVQRDR